MAACRLPVDSSRHSPRICDGSIRRLAGAPSTGPASPRTISTVSPRNPPSVIRPERPATPGAARHGGSALEREQPFQIGQNRRGLLEPAPIYPVAATGGAVDSILTFPAGHKPTATFASPPGHQAISPGIRRSHYSRVLPPKRVHKHGDRSSRRPLGYIAPAPNYPTSGDTCRSPPRHLSSHQRQKPRNSAEVARRRRAVSCLVAHKRIYSGITVPHRPKAE